MISDETVKVISRSIPSGFLNEMIKEDVYSVLEFWNTVINQKNTTGIKEIHVFQDQIRVIYDQDILAKTDICEIEPKILCNVRKHPITFAFLKNEILKRDRLNEFDECIQIKINNNINRR